ncbi:MAG: T9SS type A sorting domain-containing protein, partial [Bacteroidales bacterium]
LSHTLEKQAIVTLRIYDLGGRLIGEPVHGWYPAGTHAFSVDTRSLGKGVYLGILQSGDAVITGKMVKLQ